MQTVYNHFLYKQSTGSKKYQEYHKSFLFSNVECSRIFSFLKMGIFKQFV